MLDRSCVDDLRLCATPCSTGRATARAELSAEKARTRAAIVAAAKELRQSLGETPTVSAAATADPKR